MKYILLWGLIFSRVLFAPLVIYLAMLTESWVGPVVVAIIWFALIGDILDGIIARQLGVATPLMRRADSIADLIFWLGVGTAIWLWRPEILRPHLWWTGAPQWTLYMMLILANVSQLDRFGIAFFLPQWTPDTPSAYHAWRIRQGLPIKKHKLFHGE